MLLIEAEFEEKKGFEAHTNEEEGEERVEMGKKK